jgi:hypothetical protein
VYSFLRGAAPESIAQSFPSLTLEEVYGAIAYYLAHQAEIDAYLQEGEREFEALRQQSRQSNPLLYQKLEEARQQPPRHAKMKIRFLADADLNHDVVKGILRRVGSSRQARVVYPSSFKLFRRLIPGKCDWLFGPASQEFI